MTTPTDRPPVLRWLIGLLVLAAVCAPLLLYLRPGFLVMLADMLWACF